MDPLTHVFLGAAVGLAVCGKRLGPRAAAIGALAAFAPDADIFIRSERDPLVYAEFHRHFTHSFAFTPVGALIIASLWFAWPKQRPDWKPIWLCATLGWLSHCLLDATTSWGTRLFWPFSDHRAGWDLIAIVDPTFTLVLAVGVALALKRKHWRFASTSLLVCAGYLLLGGIQHQRALTAQARLASERAHHVVRCEMMPTWANLFVWRSLYEHDGRIYSDRIRVGILCVPTVREGGALPKLVAGQLSSEERAADERLPAFARFAHFSDGWVARSPSESALIGDARYSLDAETFEPIWGIRYHGASAVVPVEWVNRTRGRRKALDDLWSEIRGRDPAYNPLPDGR
ncbi:MAG: metal-dependent hydrolase [Pedosphaera sp.]|nr:metal-dependent hydrolase [Pedosphaera sp.]MST00425.1 metal-dependent hydrolase [Pedosphaera sp.]